MAKKSAQELAQKQREIGVAEFFARNRHLLGFDNKRKALLTTIKEAVDNSLDACEEAGILPEIIVEVIDMGNDRFHVTVEDNGPGIVKNQIPKIFAKLLYGSKFHSLKMSRGQQGIGISASVMYGQLTTGRPAKITSKTGPKSPAHYYELHINTQKNSPEILKEEVIEWEKEHGTKVEIDLEGSYIGGSQSIDEYIKETAIVNPHVTIIYQPPRGEQRMFVRAVDTLPKEPKEIKPHPYGVELGILIKMLRWTETRTLQSFLTTEFSRVGAGTAKEICENAALLPNTKPKAMSREMAEQLLKGINKTKIMNPPTDCISPIGAAQLEKGLRKEINAEFYTSVTRPPSVYRGNPFIIEAGIAYGGNQPGDKTVRILRFANRVPLIFQQGACAITKSIIETSWKSYGLQQSRGSLPVGPATIVVHIASVWVPFTSESKEAIAHYPEIIKEIKLALQECGRKLSSYVGKKRRVAMEFKKRSFIEKYIPHVGQALQELLGLSKLEEEKIEKSLKETLEKSRGKLELIEFDETKNVDYDENLARLGKEENKEEIANAKGSEED
ncbi:DNA topoisomerase VI subunit B [Candidatus Woesearchaeota archaeon]|nr:MAG: DNA topoisomerase VI subunit B [Candidatus Woesearchaeota archaeon]